MAGGSTATRSSARTAKTGADKTAETCAARPRNVRKILANTAASRWQILEAGVDKVMFRLRDGITMPEYMKLYTAVHDFCTSARSANASQAAAHGTSSQGGTSESFIAKFANVTIWWKKCYLSLSHPSSNRACDALPSAIGKTTFD